MEKAGCMQGGKQGMSDVKEGVGGDVGEKKLSQTEEERLNELLQMAPTSIAGGRHVTVGGLKTLSIFVQISIQRVPLEVFLHHIFALPPTPGLLFHFLLSSHIPGIPTHLFLILITPSFAIILQQDEGLPD